MEVVTKNNHNHNHNYEPLLNDKKSDNADVANNYNKDNAEQSPARREVREWQHINPDTGVIMKGRLEADRWIDGSQKSYGKISDSQNISQPNGTQLLQRKQLEVLQTRTINGAMQVIRTQTVQSSSSRGLSSSSITPPIFDTSNGGSFSGSKNSLSKHSSYPNSHSYLLVPHKSDCPFQLTLKDSYKINNVKNTIPDTKSMFVKNINGKILHQNPTFFNENKNSKHNIYPCTNLKNLTKNAMLSEMRPSIKLNKLMESSSSISSLTNTKSNTSNALIKSTHCTVCPQNVSLHTVVEDNKKNKNMKSSVPSSFSTTLTATRTKTSSTEISAAPTQPTAPRQLSCRLHKQPSFYGNSNSLAETCVGGHNCDADIDVSTNGGVRVAKTSPAAMSSERHQHYTVNLKEQQKKFQKKNEITPTQLSRQSRRDLESFRHYNDYDNMSLANSNDDDDLRTIQERQEYFDNGHRRLQRSHSISTDELNAECNKTKSGDENFNEWQRVSRLRRSFQSTSSGCNTHSTIQTVKRPTDLPINSIRVSKICADLEKGQRLNTAMRNNNVDLLAINTILNEPKDMKSSTVKTESVLTPKSLKEIRDKLKRLSNEALYKDDFIIYKQLPSEEEQFKEQEIKELSNNDFCKRRTQETCICKVCSEATPFYSEESNEKLDEEFNDNRLHKLAYPHKNLYTTNSLEPRRKTRENSSIEWHLRRKSYGFEKMSTVEDNSMSGKDFSTDSGLGHSSEISNCASIETVPPRRGMVIHFGDSLRLNNNKNEIQKHSIADRDINKLQKRHSIAVDEYVGENITKSSQVQFNDMDHEPVPYSKFSINVEKSYINDCKGIFQRSTQQKRVEFCKTEVHFGAESGRVNIVETDGKPPPTNNFRRRRRTVNGPLQSLVHLSSLNDDDANSNDHINNNTIASSTRFGDATTNSTQIFDEPDLMKKANVTVSVSQLDLIDNPTKGYASTNGVDTADFDNEELSNIRGILKNKLKKPKPYHLGENIKHTDVLWGVQKKEETTNDGYKFKNLQKTNTERNLKNDSHSNVHSTKINLSKKEPFNDFTNAGFLYYVQGSNHHQLNTDEGLKSTPLIIKTIRSAKEFDKAMQRLNIASVKADVKPPSVVVPSTIYHSQCSLNNLNNNEMHSFSELENPKLNSNDLKCIPQKTHLKISPKKLLDLIETTKLPINNKIVSLKHLNALPAVYQEDGESTDDEVKSYFSENHYCRDKSANTNCAPERKALMENFYTLDDLNMKYKVDNLSSNEISYKNIWNQTDLFDSNVMNIKLHSPQNILDKTVAVPITHSYSFAEKPQRILCDSPGDDGKILKPVAEQLKIVKETRGARKLRQHELSYFGVSVDKNAPTRDIRDTKTTSIYSTSPSRKQKNFFYPQEKHLNKTVLFNKGQSINNNKPDLLRHGLSEKLHSQHNEECSSDRNVLQHLDHTNTKDFDKHIYENVTNELAPIFKTKPDNITDYDRKTDLNRDAIILSEMTNDADQTLKFLSDEDKIEKQDLSRRRNLQPLQTISEKMVTKKIHDKCIAVEIPSSKSLTIKKVTSDNSRKLINATVNRSRTPSISSLESFTRSRSRSFSSDHEYENINLRSNKSIKPEKQSSSSPTDSQSLKSKEINIKDVCSKSNYKNSMKPSRDQKFESEQHNKSRSKNRLMTKSQRLHSYTPDSSLDNPKIPHHDRHEHSQKHLKKTQPNSSKYTNSKNLELNCKHKSTQPSSLTSHVNLAEIKQGRHKQITTSPRSDKAFIQDFPNKDEKEKLSSLNLKDPTSYLKHHHSPAVVMSNKTREHKNAITSTSSQATKCNEKKLREKLPTYSKNAQQSGSGQQYHTETMRSKQPQHIQHNLTTATIVGKTRDRHRKEKK